MNQAILEYTPKLTQNEWESIADALRSELQEYGALLNMLIEQQSVIIKRRSDRILELNERIAQKITSNNTLRFQREQLIARVASDLNVSSQYSLGKLLPLFPENAQGLLKALIDEIASILEKTQYKARQNQMLLMRLSEVTTQLLHSFSPNPSVRTYNKGGRALTTCYSEGAYMKATA